MGYGAFASVLTGWTGSIVFGPHAVVVYPRTSESVASLLCRVREEALFDGLTLSISVAASGVLTLSSTVAFDLTLTDLCATRTGLTAGPYSGSTSYTGAGAYTGAWVPTRGIRLDTPRLDMAGGQATSTGAYASAGHRAPGNGRASVWTSYADAATSEDASDTSDYWHDGRLVARSFLVSWRRSRMGLLPQHVVLGADAVGVVD